MRQTLLRFALPAMFVAATAHAATLTVTTTADSGPGSLRQAIESASGGDTIDATGVSGTIRLNSELSITNTLYLIGPGQENLAVDGNATTRVFQIGPDIFVSISGLTITNGNATPEFGRAWGSGIRNVGVLHLSDSTVCGNNAGSDGNLFTSVSGIGAGIYNHGLMSISNCIISHNTALNQQTIPPVVSIGAGGGIFNDGIIVIDYSVIEDNHAWTAGGIGSEDTVILSNSVIRSNTATYGGGIGCGGTIDITNVRISQNRADIGGGIHNSGTMNLSDSTLTGNTSIESGGGIQNILGTANINRCTLTTNTSDSAGGAIANDRGGIVTITNSALIGNLAVTNAAYGGAVYNLSTLIIDNSTLTGNIAGTGGGIYSVFVPTYHVGLLSINSVTLTGNRATNGGAIWASGTNIIQNSIVALNIADTNADISGSFTGTFNFVGGDPLLGPLQDNGGPTFTHALLPGSPCINAGDPNVAAPEFDQRGPGFARVVDGRIDIGAFEVQPPPDSDGDGVLDNVDQCPDTPPGDLVNATGCSIAQLVPCEGPLSGGTWKNHGQYVEAVVHAATEFEKAGFINGRQRSQIVTDAAHSNCGTKRH